MLRAYEAKCVCKSGKPSPIIDEITGERICRLCGVVLESWLSISTSQEHKEHNTKALHDNGIGNCKTGLGKLSFAEKLSRYASNGDLRVANLFGCLSRQLDHVYATEAVSDEAYVLAKKAAIKKLGHGIRSEILSAACLYVACKTHGKMVRDTEISSKLNLPKKQLCKMIRKVISELDIKPANNSKQIPKIICKLADSLDLSCKVSDNALCLYEKLQSSGVFEGRNPYVISAYLIMASCNGLVRQKQIAKAANVTEVGMRNIQKQINSLLL